MKLLALALAVSLISDALLAGALWAILQPPQMQVMCPLKVTPKYRGKWMV